MENDRDRLIGPPGMEGLAINVGLVMIDSPPGYPPGTMLVGDSDLLSRFGTPSIPSRIDSNVDLTRGISTNVGREPGGKGLVFL